MKIATIGDLHADQNKLEETKRGMKNLISVLDDEEVTWLLISGDVFHNYNIGGKNESFGDVFDSINAPLNDFLAGDERRKILMIPGNHDTPTDSNSKDALTAFEFKDKIYIARDITSFRIDNGLVVTTLPWMYPSRYKDKNELLQKLQEQQMRMQPNYSSILLGHCEIDGCDLQTGYTMLGGNFSFTREQIDGLGFDKVALGHIHKRQYHFGGVPWQHNFGECELNGEVRIIEVDDGTFISDKYVSIPNTVKYHNIKMENVDTEKFDAMDHVKVRGSRLTKQLPAGYIFEKNKEKYKPVVRTDILADDSVETLLQKWLKEQKIDTDVSNLIEKLTDVNMEGSNISKGSLSCIESIKIKGIGPHKDTFIEFKDNMIPISGHNGSGKSLMIESIFASLYGYLPSYGKITAIADAKSLIECVFVTNTKEYKVVRKTSKDKATAFLYCNRAKKPFMGPKISEVNAYIRKVVGPEELILSSVFSTQGHEGDIVDLDPSDRKNVFHKLLGLDSLSTIKDSIDVKFKNLKDKKEVLFNQVEGFNQMDDIIYNIEDFKRKLFEAQEDHAKLVDKKVRLKESNLKLIELANEYEKRLIEKNTLLNNRVLFIDTINKLINEKVYYEEYIKNTKSEDIDQLELQLEEKQDQLKIEDKKYENQKEEFEEQSRLRDVLTKVQENYNACLASIEAVKEYNHIVTKKEETAKELLADVGCKDKPIPCRFIDNALKVVGDIPANHIDFINDMNIKKNTIILLKDELDLAQSNYDSYKITQIDTPTRLNLLKDIEEINKKIKEANLINIQLVEYVTLLETTTFNLKEKEKEKISIDKSINSMYDIKEEALDEYNKSVNRNISLINQIDAQAIELTKTIVENKKELEFCKDEIEKISKYDEDIKITVDELEDYEILSKAFGMNGIPQLIIDSSLPQLQDILNLLTKSIEKFDIRISTQKLNKSGTTKETIDFIVDDGIKSRDIRFFSGGEKKLLKSLIRLSLSIFQSQKSGKSYKVLLIDEIFDNLDSDNSVTLLKMIYNLKSLFNQIFIISHSGEILGSLNKCMTFTKLGERTVVS